MRLPLVLAGALVALLVGALVALGLVLADGSAPGSRQARPPEAGAPGGRACRDPGGVDVCRATAALREWDRGRARAWASADATALASLYAPGSVAGQRDLAMLRQWRDRGLVVRGMRTQVLALVVEHADADRLELLVTDRLVGGAALGAGRRLALPADGVSRRRVTLERSAGRWRVASVLGGVSGLRRRCARSAVGGAQPGGDHVDHVTVAEGEAARLQRSGRALTEPSSSLARSPAATRSSGAGTTRTTAARAPGPAHG